MAVATMPCGAVTNDVAIYEYSVAGQQARRQQLEGRIVIAVGAGSMGASKRNIFETARELGVRTMVIDGPDSWAASLADEGVIEAFYPVNFSSDDAITLARMMEISRGIETTVGSIAGVCTFFEVAVPMTT